MRILDLSSGCRGIWIDKHNADTVYLDHDEVVAPNVVASSWQLPFSSNIFDLIVFDPPHVNFGANSNMSRDYGHYTTAQIRDLLVNTAREAHRVAHSNSLMSFKWNDHDQPFKKVLLMLAPWWYPLFGHRTAQKTKHASSTYWIQLARNRCGIS